MYTHEMAATVRSKYYIIVSPPPYSCVPSLAKHFPNLKLDGFSKFPKSEQWGELDHVEQVNWINFFFHFIIVKWDLSSQMKANAAIIIFGSNKIRNNHDKNEVTADTKGGALVQSNRV